MEIYNKKIYLIKYFHKGNKKGKKIKKIEKRVKYKNNVVEIYNFNGKLKKEYIIKNPKSTYLDEVISVTLKTPFVSVPVLSNTIVLTLLSASK